MKNSSQFDQSMQWLSRTIAVVIVMVGPGLAGSALDKRLGTAIFTPIGFLLGIVLATVALLVLAQKLAPKAGGKPLPADENDPGANAPDSADRSKG